MRLVEFFLINFPGDSWMSILVCTSLDCVNFSDIVGVVYCNMASPHVLALFSPLVVCSCPYCIQI